MAFTIDFNAHYAVESMPGVAFRLKGYAIAWTDESWDLICEDEECDHEMSEMCWLYNPPEEVEDTDSVIVVMVGDDREFTVDISELHLLPDNGYCPGCGQIGCGHYGY